MEESELRKLLQKELDGNLTEEEKQFLRKFNSELLAANDKPIFQDTYHKERIKKSIWNNIDTGSLGKKNSHVWKKYSAIAAVFIGVIITSYYLIQNAPQISAKTVPSDVITLEFEDGRVEVIEENGTTIVKDNNGSVLGQQRGNQLSYSSKNTVKNLVYNTLNVPYGKTFELRLSDGTMAHLNAGSSIRYPIQFIEGLERQVFIKGEVYLSVTEDTQHPFVVNANELNIRVLGTEFNVSAYPEDETTEVVLVEGLVSLYTDIEVYEEGKNTLLEPGFKASFDKTDEHIVKEAVATGLYTSWRKGELVFRDMTFENILKKMERRYDVRITNMNSKLSKEQFQASFGELPPIAVVLEELKQVYQINYSINGKTILIQ